MTTEVFFNYHSLNGQKMLQLFIGAELVTVSFKQFQKLTVSFTLPDSDKTYKIKNGVVS